MRRTAESARVTKLPGLSTSTDNMSATPSSRAKLWIHWGRLCWDVRGRRPMRSGPWRGTQLRSTSISEREHWGCASPRRGCPIWMPSGGARSQIGCLSTRHPVRGWGSLHQSGAKGIGTAGLCNLQRLLDLPREASQACRFSRCQSGAGQKAVRRSKHSRASGWCYLGG